jgi:DNA-binding response OmpR family regulator
VLTRDEVLRNIWGGETAVTSNVIDRHIRDLRVKLGESWRQPSVIETVPGQGYRFIGTDGGVAPIA